MALQVSEVSIAMDFGGRSQVVSVSSSATQSNPINAANVVVTPTVPCFVRQGTNPTAVNDGTDIFLLAAQYRVIGVSPGNKLSFIALSGGSTGSVYITPEA
jgi:hypothetical protein